MKVPLRNKRPHIPNYDLFMFTVERVQHIRTNNYGNHRMTLEVGIHHFVWVSILATDETTNARFGNITGGALITIKGSDRQQ